MLMRPAPLLLTTLVGAIVCVTAACSNFKAPRLSDAPARQSQPLIPASVALSFDPSVRTAILEHQACADVAWKGKLGDALVQAFHETGRVRFAQMSIADTTGAPAPVSAPGAIPITATIKLLHQSLTAKTRTGADDRYVAQVDIQLIAIFYDPQGNPLPDAPLTYSEAASIWTPLFGGSSRCATQSLDDVMKTATEQLADQFPQYVAQLVAKTQAGTVTQVASNQVPAAPPAATASAPIINPAPVAAPPAAPALSVQPPAASTHEADRYAVVVGVGLYRTPWAGWREGLAFDSKGTLSLLNHSLQVPENHTLLLQDELASQEDIEEALTSWLPKRVNKDSIVLFYFSGQALADPKTGEISLIPYDGTPASSRTRLISLRWLQSRVQKLGAKLALAVLDTPLTGAALPKDGKAKPVAPNWAADLAGASGPSTATVIQIARSTGAAPQLQGLLSGLAGEADLDHDGVVTLGEWLRSLRGSAVTVPALPPTVGVQSIPLGHVSR
ncbi:MAG: hypothetical protein RI101_11165 [Nitrospira sp.]|jgi:hypothetical protein|nr:hypothetical protein [Nitrospira sp.]